MQQVDKTDHKQPQSPAYKGFVKLVTIMLIMFVIGKTLPLFPLTDEARKQVLNVITVLLPVIGFQITTQTLPTSAGTSVIGLTTPQNSDSTV